MHIISSIHISAIFPATVTRFFFFFLFSFFIDTEFAFEHWESMRWLKRGSVFSLIFLRVTFFDLYHAILVYNFCLFYVSAIYIHL